LLAVGELLERYPEFQGKFFFAQVASPSRTKIPRYQELARNVNALVKNINAKYPKEEYQPIVFLERHHEPQDVFKLFRASDICYVSSLHDGMNLIAKEYVAARDDEQGVLILSQFTGASRELPEALIVNPYNLKEASDALAAALKMSPEDQRVRMRSMRRL